MRDNPQITQMGADFLDYRCLVINLRESVQSADTKSTEDEP